MSSPPAKEALSNLIQPPHSPPRISATPTEALSIELEMLENESTNGSSRTQNPTAMPTGESRSTPTSTGLGRRSFHVSFQENTDDGQVSRIGGPYPPTPLNDPPNLDSGDQLSRLEAGNHSQSSSRTSPAESVSVNSILLKAGSILTEMSRRVVDISGREIVSDRDENNALISDTERSGSAYALYYMGGAASSIATPSITSTGPELDSETAMLLGHSSSSPLSSGFRQNKSLGIFSLESPLRNIVCDFLVHRWTEPLVLLLIALQTVLFVTEISTSTDNYDRIQFKFRGSWTSYCFLMIFIVFTIELVMRVIASGFILKHTDPVKDPHYQESSFHVSSNTLLRPGSLQARQDRLTRRPFLRNFFNFLDFVAVLSFWISFILSIADLGSSGVSHIFQMLSALRILRLLRLTVGTNIETTIIIGGLKKAAPVLRRVVLFIGFFWLLFAVVGVQSFKSSLKRSCQWPNPNSTHAIINPFQFCGGYMDIETGEERPWLKDDGSYGAETHKGYLCPRSLVCRETLNPYNNSVSFDNIFQSLELVFVIMSANTFSDIMYYTMDSETLTAALFFAFAIIVLYYWLVILLVGVVTSSFHSIKSDSHTTKVNSEDEARKKAKQINEGLIGRKHTALQKMFQKTKWAWIIIIIYGLVAQALRSASMSDERERFINKSETIVTFILLVEIGLRFAVDMRNFHHSKQNLADLAIAIITSIIQLSVIKKSTRLYAWLTFFQIIRVYRVVWSIPLARDLVIISFKNFPVLVNLVIFLVLLVFLAAILAALMLRGPSGGNDVETQSATLPFSNLWSSFLSMYQIFTGENWTALLYTVTSYDYVYRTSWIDAIFIIVWFILSSIIIVNLFISRIQENFNISDKEKRIYQVKSFMNTKFQDDMQSDHLNLGNQGNQISESSNFFQLDEVFENKLQNDAVLMDFLGKGDMPEELPTPQIAATTKKMNLLSTMVSQFARKRPKFWTGEHTTLVHIANVQSGDDQDRSHGIFKYYSTVRRMCQRLVGQQQENHPGDAYYRIPELVFKSFIYTTIVVKILLACITTPLYQKEYFDQHEFTVLNWFVVTDLAVLAVLTVEAIIRIIAGGFIRGPDAYFRGWNLVDAIVLITLAIQVTAEAYNEGAISRVTACFKALRVLRLLTLNKKILKDISSVFTRGIIDVFAAVLVSLGLLIPFAIYGLNLFNGESLSCNDSNVWNLADCIGEYNVDGPSSSSLYAPRTLSKPYYSFDTFGSSFYSLFLIVSQEGWADVMLWARDITGRNTQPRSSSSNLNAVFFLTFNLCGTFFVLTLFISIFIQNYTKITGVAYLTNSQRAWAKQLELLKRIRPSERPPNLTSRASWRVWCYARATTKTGNWQRAILLVLILHLLLLCVDFYPSVDWWDQTRDYISLLIVTILAINVVIRIIGLSWKHFKRRSWDLYALLSLSGALITSILALIRRDNRDIVMSKELFQDSVCLLLIAQIDPFDRLFKAAIASLSLISTLLISWFVMLLFFAIALTQIFGLTRFGDNENGNANFRNIPKSLILLFRMTFGEGRTQIMEDFSVIVPPLCVAEDDFFNTDCGSAELARIFFISWKVLGVYLFTNIFVSLIYDGFSEIYQGLGNKSKVLSRQDVRQFKDVWRVMDPSGTGYIPVDSLDKLIAHLPGIFSMRIYDDDFAIKKLLENCVKGGPGYGSALTPRSRDIDLNKLNERLKIIPKDEVQHRRVALSRFREELLLFSDPVHGISFTTVLLTVAHYKVIDDNECLTFDEYLKRRVLIQKVDKTLRRHWLNDFISIYPWTRLLRNHRKSQRTSDDAS